MSASLQYSNYSGHATFAIPYEIIKADKKIRIFIKEAASRIWIIMKNSVQLELITMQPAMQRLRDLEMF